MTIQPLAANLPEHLTRFHTVKDRLPGAGVAWIEHRRAEAQRRFEALGVPRRKNEVWKYTDIRRLNKEDYGPAPVHSGALPADLQAEIEAAGADDHLVVIVNGRVRSDLCRLDGVPAGVTLRPLAEALAGDDATAKQWLGHLPPDREAPFFALNTALMLDGYVLHVPKGVRVEHTIRVLMLTDASSGPSVTHTRNLVVVEPTAEATVLEVRKGLDGQRYFHNVGLELYAGDAARLHHYTLVDEGDQALALTNAVVSTGRDTVCDTFTLTIGGDLVRNETYARMGGEQGDYRVSGAYIAGDRAHVDNTTLIDHAVPHCMSREVFQGVLDDQAHGVFQGKIIVRRDAQKTDGYQLNRALLLSRKAEINSKPELEIYADDVKCSHGATAGELDARALFYLRARGIDEATARALMVEAFLIEVIEEVETGAVQEEFIGRVRAWLSGHRDRARLAGKAA